MALHRQQILSVGIERLAYATAKTSFLKYASVTSDEKTASTEDEHFFSGTKCGFLLLSYCEKVVKFVSYKSELIA